MFNLKKTVGGLCVLFLTSSALAVTPAQHLQALLSPIKTLQANFKQTTTSKTAEFVSTAYGSVKIHRPGRFYWQVDKPGKQTIVIRNHTLWLYDVDLQQVTIKKMAPQAATLNLASLLSGDLRLLLKGNTVTESNKNGLDTIRLTPLKSGGSTKWIEIVFSGGSLHSLAFENQLNQDTSIQFSHVRVNQAIPASAFKLSLPKGVDVVGGDVA